MVIERLITLIHKMKTFFLTGPKKFLLHVVFVGWVKICFLSLGAARAKKRQAFGVKVNAFKRLRIQN